MRDEPERRCIATGRSGSKADLVRFVVRPGDTVVPDIAGRLPGRGIWVSADRAAVTRAATKGLFARAARRKVSVSPTLPDDVEALLAARVVELLSLARKAGQAVAGLEKTKAALESGGAVALVQARDGSPREKTRLRPPGGEGAFVDALGSAEMGLAFGRDRVIHAALLPGGLADSIRYESRRLRGLRLDTEK